MSFDLERELLIEQIMIKRRTIFSMRGDLFGPPDGEDLKLRTVKDLRKIFHRLVEVLECDYGWKEGMTYDSRH